MAFLKSYGGVPFFVKENCVKNYINLPRKEKLMNQFKFCILIMLFSNILSYEVYSEKLLNVHKYLQCGQTWSNNQIGACTGNNICQLGCAVTSMAMLLKSHGLNVDPGNLNTYLIANNGYVVNDCIIKWDVASGYPGSSINYVGQQNSTLSILKSEIDEDDPIIVRVLIPQEHFVVVRGYSGNGTSTSDFRVYDPLEVNERTLNNYNVHSLRIFNNVITNSTVTCNFTVNNGYNLNGWIFWKYPPMPVNFYNVALNITNLTGNWALYISKNNINIAQIAANQSVTNYNFQFAVSASDPLFPNSGGYYFRLTPQGQSTTSWCESSQFYISSLPSLSVILSPSQGTYSPGQQVNITWPIIGGLGGQYGGLTGNIRLQYYKNDTALGNIITVPITNNSYQWIVPTSISGGTIPGCGYKIAGSIQDGNAPNGYVYAFSNSFCISAPVGITQVSEIIPNAYFLAQNYPNPFNPKTLIQFDIPKISYVNLKLYNLEGKEIMELISQELKAGSYVFSLDGSELPSGVYIYNLETGGFKESKKMILLK